MLLQALSWLGAAIGFCALALAIASGLYLLSEQIEEHTVLAKRLIVRYVYVVVIVHLLLWLFDGLPFGPTLWSVCANIVYLAVMSQFPMVDFKSSYFVAACIGAIISHILWFRHFDDPSLPPYSVYETVPTYKGRTLPPFRVVASFFGLLVWTVPFLLFLSLSAGDHVLPTVSPDSHDKKRRKGLFRALTDHILHYLGWAREPILG